MKKTSTQNTIMHSGRKWLLATAILFGAASFTAQAQQKAPVKEWDKTFGGKGSDNLSEIKQTKDGGYIMGGGSTSGISGDKTGGSEYGNYWVVKVDAAGNKQWDKSFIAGELNSIELTNDGGYIIGGYSYGGQDQSEPSRGESDYWVIKLDAAGNKQWDRTYGGTGDDVLTVIKQTKDGGYIVGGESKSEISGDKTEAPKGDLNIDEYLRDFWVIKIDAYGNKEWDRTLGSYYEDFLASLEQTSDGGYMVGGTIYNGPSKDGKRGLLDYYIIKLDATGTKQWDRLYGSSGGDELHAMQQTKDGGYILGGFSWSPKGADRSVPKKGETDYWIVKIDAAGNKEWDKAYGAKLQYNTLSTLQQTNDGGYILGGNKSEASKSGNDFWIVKIDAKGNQQWDRTLGGSDYDDLTSIQQTTNGGYILGGYSNSGISGDKTAASKGDFDFWLVKLSSEATVAKPELASFTPGVGLPGTTVTIDGKHFKSTSAVLFNGVAATFKMVNDCKLTAVVPASATTGLLEVKTNGGSVLSKEVFTVLQPAITRYAPQQGRAGTTLILTGEHLATAKKVLFNGVAAENFTFLVTNSLSVMVPEGATTGKITVELKGGGKAVSTTDFVIRSASSSVATAALNEQETAAFPNPFATEVKLNLVLEKAEKVTLLVVNSSGQKVKEITFGELPAGVHKLEWNGQDSQGKPVKDGLYFYKLSANGKVTSGKMLKSGRSRN